MYAHSVSVYYAWTWNQKPWAELLEMNVKIEQGYNFVVDNESRFFDA